MRTNLIIASENVFVLEIRVITVITDECEYRKYVYNANNS